MGTLLLRRLLATTFRRTTLSESPAQFCRRMAKVEEYMNTMGDSLSLQRLGKELHERCETFKTLKGKRIPKQCATKDIDTYSSQKILIVAKKKIDSFHQNI